MTGKRQRAQFIEATNELSTTEASVLADALAHRLRARLVRPIRGDLGVEDRLGLIVERHAGASHVHHCTTSVHQYPSDVRHTIGRK